MNVYYIAGFPITDELWHHGVEGMVKGYRRYQDKEGHLTPEGREHYGVGPPSDENGNSIDKPGRKDSKI